MMSSFFLVRYCELVLNSAEAHLPNHLVGRSCLHLEQTVVAYIHRLRLAAWSVPCQPCQTFVFLKSLCYATKSIRQLLTGLARAMSLELLDGPLLLTLCTARYVSSSRISRSPLLDDDLDSAKLGLFVSLYEVLHSSFFSQL